ncbi:phosphogluconate dehydrogenase (NAD(+)-dependent, decarboxylating) [Spiroplasma clarkii]|uniref:6-phosphogluconate dehydrogenase n=1 Tax=Spiroplasma clarkii TaxID=2139 RepID=A0A2K8KLJ5_9MOLU|nr:decarboxylating 6-phosphogluconate dehydrogenase [Spiroplasma clarkii]ATX71469.1 6-phosphogluconate dehydrogenase [Spiroplasma clarkii]
MIGLIGLGKMGLNLIKNMAKQQLDPVGFDIDQKTYPKLTQANIKTASSLVRLIEILPKPRTVMLLLPSGAITQNCFEELLTLLEPGDVIIDAGNSHYQDSIKRYQAAQTKKIDFMDCGTSGGQSGALNGACLMVGGDLKVVQKYEEIFKKLAVTNGYLHTGAAGSGHYCKMIHNGIEYGMMQAIAEGYELLQNSEFDFDLAQVSKMWNHGSVIRSWLIELAQAAFENNNALDNISGVVNMNGEGLWTVEEAMKQGTPAPVIALSVIMRQRSKQQDTFAGKVLAALRNGFGGHEIQYTKK